MKIPKPIYILSGTTPYLRKTEIASRDVKSLQIMLTDWLRTGGNGFIWRIS